MRLMMAEIRRYRKLAKRLSLTQISTDKSASVRLGRRGLPKPHLPEPDFAPVSGHFPESRFHGQWCSSEWLADRSLQLYGLLGPPVGPEVVRSPKARPT